MNTQRKSLFFRFALVSTVALLSACTPKGGSGAATSGTSQPEDVPAGGNLLKNATFENGSSLPWNSSFSPPANGELAVVNGAACLTIADGGSNNWDAQIRHREMTVEKGHTYNIAFKIWADKPTMVRPKVGQAGPPYTEYWNQTVHVTTAPQLVRGGFVMQGDNDPTVEFAFHAGGNMMRGVEAPVTICIDDVYMSDVQFTPTAEAKKAPLPAIRINELGYFTHGKKVAAVVNESTNPIAWKLMQGGTEVASGQTYPFGLDTDSGDNLHLVDFTSVQKPGAGYILNVGDDTSTAFNIADNLYSNLKYDALRYFYHNRSGIEIKMPFAVDPKWTRPAGHVSDSSVACAPDAGCTYSLDVSKGWYDAGDHGKYVVNGGIAVWTMMNQFEFLKTTGDATAFADGKMNIPESGNGVPDILDEARWEMEFLLGMQVPNGQKNAGMVHHKMHDDNWTALGIAPHDAEKVMKRHLRPVSTAATLNLAATAAQAARLFKGYDPAFSARCLKAAETAWLAAKQHPAVYAPASDSNGGGPYDDTDVSDEFYWAAAELYITTKQADYKAALDKSPYSSTITLVVDGVPSAMNWGKTDALGSMSLALVPGAVSAAEQKTQKAKIQKAAETFLALVEAQGYRMPFSAGDSGKYPWGSNSFLINNLITLGYAYQFSKDDKYLEGMILGMDYLLGRNAMAQSYISGYGTNPLRNPHHRFWSNQVDSRFPSAPPGALSGGPNSGLQDPYVKAAGLPGCAPQKCFVDHIEAWSVNEITVNWNAPLAWVAGFLDANGSKAKAK